MMMSHNSYLDDSEHAHPVVAIVAGVDKDVERGEDILMLGYGLVLMAPIFAPIAPPRVLLPLMALCLVCSVCRARLNFLAIRDKFAAAVARIDGHQESHLLRPISEIFVEHPQYTLNDGFNPLKNWARTAKSVLGGLLVNPLWMPIFYALGLQFAEEKQLGALNRAVMQVEEKAMRWRT